MKLLAIVAVLVPVAGADLPLSFEPNQGQADGAVRFLARAPGRALYLTSNEGVVTNGGAVLRLRLLGARVDPSITGLDPLPGKSHYFRGSDPSRWRTNVAQYGRVRYQGVYPGIDLIYYGNQEELEHDFLVGPGADPRQIRFTYAGPAGCGSTRAASW